MRAPWFPSRRPLLAAFALVALACSAPGAPPAEAQARHARMTVDDGRTMRMVWIDGRHSIEARLEGKVDFGEDDRSVVAVSPGGRFRLEERTARGPARRAEWTHGADGGVAVAYWVDDRQETLDADGRAWIERLLPDILREHGVNAEARVRRLLERGGPDAVLADIAKVRSDGTKRRYFGVLFEQARLTADQAGRAFWQASRTISSDGDLTAVLVHGLERVDIEAEPTREAWFAAADEISSDGDHAEALRAVLERGRGAAKISDATLVELLRSAAGISSDGDKARVLMLVAERGRLESGPVRDAFFAAARTISSDGDRSRVLLSVLHAHSGADAVAAAVLRSATEISSDGDKARVLLAVPAERLRASEVREAYRDAVRTISSDGDRGRAEHHADLVDL
jgi:hypothetical protein